jgi:hypothetical protein
MVNNCFWTGNLPSLCGGMSTASVLVCLVNPGTVVALISHIGPLGLQSAWTLVLRKVAAGLLSL